MRRSILLAPIVLLVACDSKRSDTPDPLGPDAGPSAPDAMTPPDAEPVDEPDGGTDPQACASVFDAAVVPDYYVTISATEEAELLDEFLNRATRIAMGLDEHPWHPIDLEVVIDGVRERPTVPVLIRLKGQSSWQQTVDLDENPKMQFVIAFNEVDHDGRFHGLRKVELDMPRSDWTFLKQRLALSYMREAGVYAQCANSARLYLNGDYYGLYTHLERLDKEFLQRYFGDADDGDLWETGRYIKTNEDHARWDRIVALWSVEDFAQFDELADVDASISEWAIEAMVGDADGYYVAAPNFFVYDHPTRGYLWVPHDVDTAFDSSFLPDDITPVIPPMVPPNIRNESFWYHYLLVMHDGVEIQRYVDALAVARSKFDVGALQARLDTWAAQIADAAAADPHRPFSIETHLWGLARMRNYIEERAEYIDAWLACWSQGGADGDGDGIDMCHDCDDYDPTVRPGAVEVCDWVDQDCDGHVDSTNGVSVCSDSPPPP